MLDLGLLTLFALLIELHLIGREIWGDLLLLVFFVLLLWDQRLNQREVLLSFGPWGPQSQCLLISLNCFRVFSEMGQRVALVKPRFGGFAESECVNGTLVVSGTGQCEATPLRIVEYFRGPSIFRFLEVVATLLIMCEP